MLDKLVWTESDFEVMGWHDVKIWGLAFLSDTFELLLDIDYIAKWELPEGDSAYRFWIAPATLVFHNVTGLTIEAALDYSFEIDELERTSPGTPRNAEVIGKHTDWAWILSLRDGNISFRSIGYTQFIRRPAEPTRRQFLTLEGRGGLSFARTDAP